MAQAAPNMEQGFWQPPLQGATAVPEGVVVNPALDACSQCDAEFMVGARFCYVCGAARPGTETALPGWTQHLEIQNLKERLGLSNASMAAFLIGVGCVFGAIMVGFVFSAQTVLDWQAVQIWRVQWLLGAVAAFVAGILLKKPA